MRSTLLFLFPVAALSGCCPRPWGAHPMDTPPDAQCRVGETTHGYDLYIWDCTDTDDGQQKVVISFYSAEMSCAYPEKEELPCGESSELEEEFASQLGEDCEPPPQSLRWD